MSELILGIESSCDECSASVVHYQPGRLQVVSLVTASQINIHKPYGGVVPELASRNHLETIQPVIDEALAQAKIEASQLSAIGVTNRPGLMGSLLVGVTAAKSLAYTLGIPVVPVHHLEAHLCSLFLNLDRNQAELEFPLLLALVSGGHTNLYVIKEPPELWPLDFLKKSLIGRSRDDAAGEAFDKTAKSLGLPYPGGVWIDRKSEGGDPKRFPLPRALPQKDTLDFSFSGLKTAVALLAESLRKEGRLETELPHVCASVQEAITGALVSKILLARRVYQCRMIAVAGGVAANRRLRQLLSEEQTLFPDLAYCTDNAAMVGAAGAFRFRQGHSIRGEPLLTLTAIANPDL